MNRLDPIAPHWPGPERVRALVTTRQGGVSLGPWRGLNLSSRCGDDSEHVAENLRRLGKLLPAPPRWLRQVHGSDLIHLDDWQPDCQADAAWTDRPGQVCAVLTADCLPVLMTTLDGRLVAAVHAGWRGLAAGILAKVTAALPAEPGELLAFVGPAISARHYEVDEPVKAAFVDAQPELIDCFHSSRPGHWLADLPALAARLLATAGVAMRYSSQCCTFSDSARFYSYRRDAGRTGRQASLIWIEPEPASQRQFPRSD